MKRVTVLQTVGKSCPSCYAASMGIAVSGDSVGRAKAESMDSAIPSSGCSRPRGKCKPRDSHIFMHSGKAVEPSEMDHQHAGAGRPVGELIRDRAVTVRLTAEEWEQVHAEAARRDLSVSTVVRVMAMERLG